jgi:hypothetical protein
MLQRSKNHNWDEDKNDPDNWLVIPEFGVNPIGVSYKGFEEQIETSDDLDIGIKSELRKMVATARQLAKMKFTLIATLDETYEHVVREDEIHIEIHREEYEPNEYELLLYLNRKGYAGLERSYTPEEDAAIRYRSFMSHAHLVFLGLKIKSFDTALRSYGSAAGIVVDWLEGKPLPISKSQVHSQISQEGHDTRYSTRRGAKTWVQEEWQKQTPENKNKTTFADKYKSLVHEKFGLRISTKQMKEVWLKNTPPASKQAGLPADR